MQHSTIATRSVALAACMKEGQKESTHSQSYGLLMVANAHSHDASQSENAIVDDAAQFAGYIQDTGINQ
jgi:hypothetical protein